MQPTQNWKASFQKYDEKLIKKIHTCAASAQRSAAAARCCSAAAALGSPAAFSTWPSSSAMRACAATSSFLAASAASASSASAARCAAASRCDTYPKGESHVRNFEQYLAASKCWRSTTWSAASSRCSFDNGVCDAAFLKTS